MVPSLRLFPERKRRRSGSTGLQRLERQCPRLRLALSTTNSTWSKLFSFGKWLFRLNEHTGREGSCFVNCLLSLDSRTKWYFGNKKRKEKKNEKPINQSLIYMKIWIQNHMKRQTSDIGYVELLGTWKCMCKHTTILNRPPLRDRGVGMAVGSCCLCPLKSPKSKLVIWIIGRCNVDVGAEAAAVQRKHDTWKPRTRDKPRQAWTSERTVSAVSPLRMIV